MSTALHVAKKLLRKELRSRLKSLADEQKSLQSKIVTEQVLSLKQFKDGKRIAIYLSMPSEVDTHEIMKRMFMDEKKCFIPHYVGDTMNMVFLRDMDDYDRLPLTSWNIKQPADNEERETAIQTGGLDMILVPGLGFTKNGERIGRGKGYYDNYLKKYKHKFGKAPFTVGLSFKEQICEEIPTTEDDYPLDLVLC